MNHHIDIDRAAPVVSEAAATSAAPPAAVHAAIRNPYEWTAQYPELKDIDVEPGDIGVGTTFSFRTGPGRIDAEVIACDEPTLFAFRGRGMGATSTYVFRIEPDGHGSRIVAAQSMNGIAVRTMKPMLQKISSQSLETWVFGIAACAR